MADDLTTFFLNRKKCYVNCDVLNISAIECDCSSVQREVELVSALHVCICFEMLNSYTVIADFSPLWNHNLSMYKTYTFTTYNVTNVTFIKRKSSQEKS